MGLFSFITPKKKKVGKEDVSNIPLPAFLDVLAGQFKSYEDPLYRLALQKGYQLMRSQDVIAQPMTKLARRVGSMVPVVVGSGQRRDMLQKIIDQTYAFGDILEWLAWADIEGVRFAWLRNRWNDDFENGKGAWIPDFRGCGRMKYNAGGNYKWEGWDSDKIGKVGEVGAVSLSNTKERESAEPAFYDRERVLVFRPGAGDNPEGDLDRAVQLYLLADAAAELDKAMRLYQERYSLPREIMKKMLDKLRPDEVATVMQTAVGKIRQADARTKMTLSDLETMELLEPKGATWQFLSTYRMILSGRGHKMITGENLTSDSTGSGDSGSSDLSDKQLNSGAVNLGRKIAEALNNDWLPFIEESNDHVLPRLRSSEPIPYLELRPPVEKQRISIAELVQVVDRRIPLDFDFVYEVIGTRQPEEGREFVSEVEPVGTNAKNQPSNTGESVQRKDREQEGSNIPDSSTRKRDPKEDLRNTKKDSE